MKINDDLQLSFIDVPNRNTGGWFLGSAIPTRAAIDSCSVFNFNQTKAGQNFTLPNPTDTANFKVIWINNVGTAAFSIFASATNKTLILPNESIQILWNGTTWSFLLGKNKTFSRVNYLFATDINVNIDFLNDVFLIDLYDVKIANHDFNISATGFIDGGVYTLQFKNCSNNNFVFDAAIFQDINGAAISRKINGSKVLNFTCFTSISGTKLLLTSETNSNVNTEIKETHGNYTILETTKDFFYQDTSSNFDGYTLTLPPQYPINGILNIWFSDNRVMNFMSTAGYIIIAPNAGQTILANSEGAILKGNRAFHELVSLQYFENGLWRIVNHFKPQ